MCAAGLVLLCGAVTPVAAESWSYRDDQGRLHVVDGRMAVPKRYRAAAKPVGAPDPAPSAPRPGSSDGSAAAGSPAPDAGGSGTEWLFPTPAPAAPTAPSPASEREPSADGSAVGGPGAGATSLPPEPSPDEASEPPPPPASTAPGTCKVELAGEPKVRAVGRLPKVTFSGSVVNNGTGRARGVSLTIEVFSEQDGDLLDRVVARPEPSDLDPGASGTYEATLDYKRLGLRQASKDKVALSFVRCEQARAAVTAAPKATGDVQCPLNVPKPQPDTDSESATVRYSGTVTNQGPGRARGIDLRLRVYRAGGELHEEHRVDVSPSSLAPGASATYTIEIPQDFGVRAPKRDQFVAEAVRCERVTP